MRPVANGQRPLQVFIDGHPAARQSPAPGRFLDLENPILQTDRVVSIHHALVLERKNTVQVPSRYRQEGSARLSGRVRKTTIELPDSCLHVRGQEVGAGKSKNAVRNLSLTPRVKAILEARPATTASAWVFPSRTGKPYVVTSLDHMHVGVTALLRLPKDFVVHSLRHTFGTRMGEAGADAFDIKRLMGHSSVTVSQRYVHPTPESL